MLVAAVLVGAFTGLKELEANVARQNKLISKHLILMLLHFLWAEDLLTVRALEMLSVHVLFESDLVAEWLITKLATKFNNF